MKKVQPPSKKMTIEDLADICKQQFSNIQNNFTGLRNEFTDLGGEFTNLRGEFTGLKNEFVDLRGEFTDLSSEVGSLKSEFIDLRTDVKLIRNDINQVSMNVDNLAAMCQRQFKSIDDELTSIKDNVSNCATKGDLSSLELRMGIRSDKLDESIDSVLGVLKIHDRRISNIAATYQRI